jgi:hypothetical protein
LSYHCSEHSCPTEDNIDDVKDGFYEELEHMIDKFPKYHMKILLGNFSAKVGREDIFKQTNGNESLHEISNDNGVRVVNLATCKNRSKVQCSLIATFLIDLDICWKDSQSN